MVHGESDANVMIVVETRDTRLIDYTGYSYESCKAESVRLPGKVLTEPLLLAGLGIVQKCVVYSMSGQFWAYVSPQNIEPIEI